MIELPELAGPFVQLASAIDAVVYVAGRDPRRPLAFVSPAVERFFGFTPGEWLERDDSLQRHLHPADAQRVRDALGAWLAAGATAPLNLKYALVAKDGRICWCRETVIVAGEHVAGAIIDVTELKVLQNTLEAVAGAAHPREALLAFCDALAQALALDEAGWVSPARGERLHCRYAPLGVRESADWDGDAAAAPGLGEKALAENRTVFTAGEEGATALATPVPGEGGPQGALTGSARKGPALTPHLLRLAEALGQQAAVALQRADLVAQRQRLADALVRANEAERARLSAELHDGAGQTLTAVAIQLDLAERAIPEPGRAPLQKARREVEATLEELRRLSHALRPAALDRLGLGEALREMCLALRGPLLEVRLALPGQPLRLPDEQATALFRIAQSALTNVVRHAAARAAEVRLSLDQDARAVALEVVDDGRGFEPHRAPRALGLFAMRERALALGGELEVRSAPGAGTTVRATLPLQ